MNLSATIGTLSGRWRSPGVSKVRSRQRDRIKLFYAGANNNALDGCLGIEDRDANKGETPWGEMLCDPWVSIRETKPKPYGAN